MQVYAAVSYAAYAPAGGGLACNGPSAGICHWCQHCAHKVGPESFHATGVSLLFQALASLRGFTPTSMTLVPARPICFDFDKRSQGVHTESHAASSGGSSGPARDIKGSSLLGTCLGKEPSMVKCSAK